MRTVTYHCPTCDEKVVGYDPAKACADCIEAREVISNVGDWDDEIAHDIVTALNERGFSVRRDTRP